ncbi:MAG: hypothetical protein KKE62_11990 [Proteobacteria bacterium]|nr:hypothetical protein [Pseudomonadota bacterium]MBU1388999.1 hypothetical protein [Pseudomonadota bacterium]MBU1543551.1 hypothetical protein [Pseudomonadota bacterium]MBU2480647.1 hypothetical protein [Pseudomonadota bacterium]
MKAVVINHRTHNPFEESHWVSRLRENLTSGSDGEGLETDRKTPRQSFTRQLFFKAIKQNLRIKTFVGTSENALYIQIWTALIAMLLIKFLQLKSKFDWSLSNLIAFLRWNLFSYKDLWGWLDKPFDIVPEVPPPIQMQLPLKWV